MRNGFLSQGHVLQVHSAQTLLWDLHEGWVPACVWLSVGHPKQQLNSGKKTHLLLTDGTLCDEILAEHLLQKYSGSLHSRVRLFGTSSEAHKEKYPFKGGIST